MPDNRILDNASSGRCGRSVPSQRADPQESLAVGGQGSQAGPVSRRFFLCVASHGLADNNRLSKRQQFSHPQITGQRTCMSRIVCWQWALTGALAGPILRAAQDPIRLETRHISGQQDR